MLRKLDLADMDAAAAVHRAAFDHALPWLAGLHTPQEDRRFFRERVLSACEVWGASDGSGLVAIIAFREGWIDQLYVLPTAQRRGIGTALLDVARSKLARLELWTFQRNAQARRFYESRGFVLVEETDGARNEEREPDARYLWSRDQS
jgi:ribosomal protein S18 acetylase RimI-like enzyme